jgi:GTP-binding protein
MTVSLPTRCLRAGSGSVFMRLRPERDITSKATILGRRGLRTRRRVARPITNGGEGIPDNSEGLSDVGPVIVSWDEIASKIQDLATQQTPKSESKKHASPKPTGTKQKPPASSSKTNLSLKAAAISQSQNTGPQPKSRDYLKLPSNSLSEHWDTLPPSKEQLVHAEKFFRQRPARPFVWSAPKFHSMAFGTSPEVCFLGRSNVGKSSLLNALLGGGFAHVSSKPGRTKMMNAFDVGNSTDPTKNLVVLDMPGYGKGGQADWGIEVLKYLGKRKQLKRAFVLIDAEVGLKSTDEQLLAVFRKEEIPHQIVLSKVDKLLFPKNRKPSEGALESRLQVLRRVFEMTRRTTQPNPEDMSGALGEIIACCSERPFGQILGINEVRHAMLQAAGLEKKMERKLIAETEIVPHDEIFRKES